MDLVDQQHPKHARDGGDTASAAALPAAKRVKQGDSDSDSAAVETAGKRVNALEAEENVLEEQIALLEEHCFGPPQRRGEVTKQLQDLKVFVPPAVEEAKAKLAKLKENLKSVREELLGVMKQKTLAMQRQILAMKQPETLLEAEGLLERLPPGCEVKTHKLSKLLDRDDDFNAVKEYLAAVQNKSGFVEWQSDEEVRTTLYLVYAVKGGGKTWFLKTITNEHAVKNEHGGAGIFVSYNEDTAVGSVTRGDELRCFAVHLLRNAGVPDDVAKRVASLDAALAFMRKVMGVSDLAPLTICVDEIAALERPEQGRDDPAQVTIRALMAYQDAITNDKKKAPGRVYFIFSSLIASYVKVTSSRAIVKHGLKNLREASATALLSGASKKLVEDKPAVAMIFKSLAGHPRAVVEGFNVLAVKTYDGSDASLFNLLKGIMRQCKFANAPGSEQALMAKMEAVVSLWIARKECEDRDTPRLRGWLQESSTGEEVLSPFVLRFFSESDKMLSNSVLRKELQKLYHADLAVCADQGKNAEKLLCQFEIVQKLCRSPMRLKDFFAGGAFKDVDKFGDICLHMHSPGVCYVESFAATDTTNKRKEGRRDETAAPAEDIATLLLYDKTVVSERQDERGVEYLCPFFKRAFDPLKPYELSDLLVAMVQVKYLDPESQRQHRKPSVWETYADDVTESAAKAYLKAKKIAHFTVFYTLSDNVPEEKEVNTVYFNRDGMKLFLKKLGPLWYHEEQSSQREGMVPS